MNDHATYWPGRVRAAFSEAFAEDSTVDEGFGPLAVDVPPQRWVEALALARDALDCTFFDWLSAVDELQDGFRVVCHLADHRPGGVEHLVLRTLVPRESPALASVTHVFAGARWHERETHEMFGIDFTDPRGSGSTSRSCCCPRSARGTRCARTSCSPRGWRSRGRVRRSRGSPTTRRPRRPVVVPAPPACPSPSSGGRVSPAATSPTPSVPRQPDPRRAQTGEEGLAATVGTSGAGRRRRGGRGWAWQSCDEGAGPAGRPASSGRLRGRRGRGQRR